MALGSDSPKCGSEEEKNNGEKGGGKATDGVVNLFEYFIE